MHPAPSLAEAFPKSEDPRSQQQPSPHHQSTESQTEVSLDQLAEHLAEQNQQRRLSSSTDQRESLPPPQPNQTYGSPQSHPGSPPLRKDTASSTSTNLTDATLISSTSNDTNSTVYSVESSQSIFNARDGADVSSNRRASRRRTGPLSAAQREKAALIRKVGACNDCRRRRVACHPNHHGMSWEDAVRKYRSSSPNSMQHELAPLAQGRPLSPAPSHLRPPFTQDPQEMEIDSPTPTPPNQHVHLGRPSLSESRIRTPLPSQPRMDRLPSLPSITPGPPPILSPKSEALKADLQNTASRILSSPSRSRYAAVHVLLLQWEEDPDLSALSAVNDLGEVFEKYYNYTFQPIRIPPPTDGCKSAWRWLTRIIDDFTENADHRDTLKIVYYNGHTYLDDNREMVLASSPDKDKASTIKWSGIQQILEEARSDTLIIMDAVYYPAFKMARQKGMLEIIAASASQDQFQALGRNSFTKAFIGLLRDNITQTSSNAMSAADTHSRLLSIYPKIIHERHSDGETLTNFPSPLHMQTSGNSRLPSITLSPLLRPTMMSAESPSGISHMTLSIRLSEDNLDVESWTEWLRLMPDGIKDLKVDGPYRTLR